MGESIEISRLPERIVYCSVRCRRNVTKYTAVYKPGKGRRGRGHWDACVGTLGLGNARRRTWGHQVWDVGTCGTGTRDVKYGDAGTSNTGTQGCECLLQKSEGNAISVTFLLNMS